MTKYLLILSIGPVQTMIAAARRSRDLWSGSWLLSELSKACAKSLYNQPKTTLIFPHIDKASNLDVNTDFSVGNKIQAVVETESLVQLEQIIDEAKTATRERFKAEAQNALSALKNKDDIHQEIWNEQLGDYVEIQAAWAEIIDDKYHEAVSLASKTLAARKATRDFKQLISSPYDDKHMIPKSSLDGMRETVLKESEGRGGAKIKRLSRIQLSLNESEQLDTIGVIKRLGFGQKAEQFTPISRVATDPWIKEVLAENPNALDAVKSDYEELIKQGLATRVTGNRENGKSIYQDFAFDGQYLYKSRIETDIEKYKDDANIVQLLTTLKTDLQPIWKQHGQPVSYSALLLADGDKMGELLDKAETQEQHQAITQALSGFAENVAQTMREFRGHCIYSGGDDVLGFVPLHEAIECADKLRTQFADSLKQVATDLNAQTPTLSVGIAITHIMTPFGVVRELAKQAEKHAKGDHIKEIDQRRNALAVLLSVRSGTDTKLRIRWDDDDSLQALEEWMAHYQNKTIPSRIAYGIRDIFIRTKYIAQDDPELHKDIQMAELTRMLKQARTASGDKLEEKLINKIKERAENIGLNVLADENRTDKDTLANKNRVEKIGLDALADELIVARWLAIKTQKELGKEQ